MCRSLVPIIVLASTVMMGSLVSACREDTTGSGSAPEPMAATEAPIEDAAALSDPGVAGAPGDVFAHEPARTGGVLVVAASEPDTLYINGSNMIATFEILNALYDSPMQTLGFDYQAAAVERVPRLEDDGSGAVLELVSVEPGERFVDPETQQVVTATEVVSDLPQLTARFTFRDGLTWEDGAPVTADDAVFAQGLRCHPDSPSSKQACDRTAQYVKIDSRTVEWKGLPGYSDQTYYANVYTPLPRHQVGAAGTRMDETSPADILEDEVFTRSPLSYGPFKMVEWVAGDHIKVERNPSYWRSDEGLPFLDEVIFHFVTEPNAVLAALKSGDVDVARQTVDQLDALDQAAEEGQLTVNLSPQNTAVVVAFNVDPVDERVPVAACGDVRRAMTLAHDRQTVVDVLGRGKIDVLHNLVPPGHWAALPEHLQTRYEYDPERGALLLEDLGFVDEDGDGVREAVRDITCPIIADADGTSKEHVIPLGTRMKLTLNLLAADPLVEEWGLLFQQNMADVGVEVDLEFLPGQVLLAKGPDGQVLGRRFDLAAFAWRSAVQPPTYLYYCDQIPSDDNAWSGMNLTGWCDPEYQRLGLAAESSISRTDALPNIHEAQQIYGDSLPTLPVCTWPSIVAMSPEVVNVRPNPSQSTLTWNLETWGFAE